MKVSRKWIDEEFVDLANIDDQTFQEVMTAVGLMVRSCEQVDDDTVVELEVMDNRSDCHCIIGIAREAAAAFGRPMRSLEPSVKGSDTGSIYELLDVDVPADELCNRCTVRVVSHVHIGPSPAWLCHRLQIKGIEPVNNIVDIANYVMLEYGQPIFALDFRKISSGEMVIREAEAGEVLTSCNGDLLQLEAGVLVIADGEHAIALAGIPGAVDHGINAETDTVIFASANFIDNAVTKTARSVEERTWISDLCEKKLDPMMTLPAVQRACELVERLECGEVLDGIIDILNYVPEPKTLEFDAMKINQILGTEISEHDMISYLKRLEIYVEDNTVLIPSFRQDLNSITDIAGEVWRQYAYPTKLSVQCPNNDFLSG